MTLFRTCLTQYYTIVPIDICHRIRWLKAQAVWVCRSWWKTRPGTWVIVWPLYVRQLVVQAFRLDRLAKEQAGGRSGNRACKSIHSTLFNHLHFYLCISGLFSDILNSYFQFIFAKYTYLYYINFDLWHIFISEIYLHHYLWLRVWWDQTTALLSYYFALLLRSNLLGSLPSCQITLQGSWEGLKRIW